MNKQLLFPSALVLITAAAGLAAACSAPPSPSQAWDPLGDGTGAASDAGADADPTTADPSGEPGDPGDDPQGTGSNGKDGGAAQTGSCAPADVTALMQKRCAGSGCHAPSTSARPPLLTYADLTATSKIDPSMTVAERSLVRMKDKADPMPQAGLLPTTEIAPLQNWVNSGMKGVACATGTDAGATDSGTTVDEFNVPATCTNGTSSAGNGASMKPGVACNNCHNFGIAGTVYPTAHEPDKCKGISATGAFAGTKIVVTDAQNKTYSVTVNSAGNFASNTYFAPPYTVKVITAAGHERAMSTPLKSTMGDCNSCHTQNGSGTPKAPGRILQPK